MDNISIIIRNRNEEEFIGFAIQSCLDFFDKPEIIIVDNNSTDSSLEIVNLFSDRTKITIVNNPEYTPGSSINLGVSKSTNKYILILSAHSKYQTILIQLKIILNLILLYLESKIQFIKGKKLPHDIFGNIFQTKE